MEPSAGLTVIDYVVIAILLLIPLGIGVLFAYIDRNRSNREEYLLGGRQMSLLPITMSLFVTFQVIIPASIFYRCCYLSQHNLDVSFISR